MSAVVGKKPYSSARSMAWRNTVVAATNATLEQGLFSLRPGDNRWSDDASPHGAGFSFTFGDGVPAFARVRDMGYDELEISVALWPKPGVGIYVNYFDAGFAEGDVIATGMIERRRGAWLQSSPGLFRCRKKRVGDVAAVSIEPNGYRDHGPVIL